jgi:hypothetical protein
MSRPRTRPLSQGERDLAFEVFGRELRLDTIRFWAAPWPFTRAFVPGRWFGRDWIVWPKVRLPDDMADAALGQQAVFIHELVHVWQAQQGLNLLFGKLKAGDSLKAYTYPISDGCNWAQLNIEQQAMIVEHRFRLSRGGRVPADQAFYDRVCPLASRIEI